MSTTHQIPTTPNPCRDQGHFKSEAIVLVEGSSLLGGPGGWLVGGWDATGEGRVEFGGPMVKGPYAYIAGRSSIIDNHGGTGAEHERAEAKGLMFKAKDGDTLTLFGTEFTLSVDGRGYPHLTVKEPEIETKPLFIVKCSTGCSCCSDENHVVGPYSTQEKADEAVTEFRLHPRLGSQYAPNGIYTVSPVDAEPISRGRWIVDDRVIDPIENPMDGGCVLYGWQA